MKDEQVILLGDLGFSSWLLFQTEMIFTLVADCAFDVILAGSAVVAVWRLLCIIISCMLKTKQL